MGLFPDRTRNAGRQMSTIDCPDAGIALPDVPEQARPEVDRELAAMDTQITDAYRQFADRKEQIAQDPNLAENSVLGPLKNKRAASLDRIGIAIERNAAQRPQGLDGLAPCSLRADDDDNQGGGQDGGQGVRTARTRVRTAARTAVRTRAATTREPIKGPTRARTAARTAGTTRAGTTASKEMAPKPPTLSTSSPSSPMSTGPKTAGAPPAVRSPPTAAETRTANSTLTTSLPHPE